MRKVLAFPLGVLRTMARFVSPPRNVHRVPLGRFLIVLQLDRGPDLPRLHARQEVDPAAVRHTAVCGRGRVR